MQLAKYGITKRKQQEEDRLRWDIKNSQQDLDIKERTVAKWIGYLTKHNGKGVNLVVADGYAIRELPKTSYKGLRQLEVSHRAVITQVLAHEKELFVGTDDVMETIYSLMHKSVVNVQIEMKTFSVDDGSNPNHGQWTHGNVNLFLRLNTMYY